MAGLFSKPKTPTYTPPVTQDSSAVKEAAFREAERLRKRKGARSTIATGPGGLETTPTTLKPTLGS